MKKEGKLRSLLSLFRDFISPALPTPHRDWMLILLLFVILNLAMIAYNAHLFVSWEVAETERQELQKGGISLTENDLREVKEIFEKRDSRYQALILNTGEVSFPPDPSVSEEEEEDEDDDESPDQEDETEDDQEPGQDEEGVETTENEQEEIPEN